MSRRRPLVASFDVAVVAFVIALFPATAGAVVAPERMTAEDPALHLDALALPRASVVGTEAAPVARGHAADRRARVSREALEALAPGAAARFKLTTNAWTGLPHRAWGPAIAITNAPVRDAAQAEAASRAWLFANVPFWAGDDRPAASDLKLVKSRHVGVTWFLVYQQFHRGVEVEGGRVDLRLRDDGRLSLVGSDWLPGIQVDPGAARLPQGVADARARTPIGFDAARDRFVRGERIVLPLPGADGTPDYRVAYRVVHRTIDPPALWRSYVDAETGDVLARENDLRYDTLVGRVTGMVHPARPTDPLVQLPLREAVLTTTVDSVYTGADGRYSFPNISTGFVIRAGLRGPFEEIVRFSGGAPFQQASAPANDTLNFNWQFPQADSSEADAFYHVGVVRQYIKGIEPGFVALDYRMPVTVNIPAVCNAFWDGVGVNFFRFGIRGDGVACANTGMIADVVYHEFGHGRTQEVWAPFGPSGAMHEGLSDYLAATLTNQPVIGRGFFGPGTSIRTAENTVQINSVSCGGAVHCVGTAIAGSLWDLRRNLIASLGDSATAIGLADSLFHFAGYGGAPWHDDYLLDLLLVDDNDGTLLNGTPHYGAICPAFAAHGIPCPDTTSGVWVAHVPLPDAGLAAGPFQVDATMGSFADAFVPATAKVVWRVENSPWNTVAMTPLGGDQYRGFIPALPGGGRVDYYVEGRDAGNRIGSSPEDAPAAFHTFYIGNLTTVFADDFEIDRGWSSVIAGAVTGRWMRADPNGTPDPDFPEFLYAPEDDHTPNPAHFAYVTGDTTAGIDLAAADVDGGCVTLLSPVIDLSARANARLEYWRWFTDETRYDDTLSVAVSSNGGASWVDLERQPFTQNAWLGRSFDIAAYVPLTNQFRFRVQTCDGGGGSLLEAGLDDFLLTTRVYGAVSAGDPPAGDGIPTAVFIGAIDPNPAGSGRDARIAFGVPRTRAGTAPALLQVVDLRGRIVRTLLHAPLAPGLYSARWDGTTQGGARTGAGVYFVRLVVDGHQASEKIVRLD